MGDVKYRETDPATFRIDASKHTTTAFRTDLRFPAVYDAKLWTNSTTTGAIVFVIEQTERQLRELPCHRDTATVTPGASCATTTINCVGARAIWKSAN